MVAFGIVATNPTQLAVADTPAVMVTVSLVAPEPPVQYMVKLQTPAVTVCAGRLVNPQVVVTPPDADWIALISLAAHDLTALLLGRPDDVLAQKPDPQP